MAEAKLLLTDPVDQLCPPRLVLQGPFTGIEQIAGFWVSDAGNYCVGVNYMDECGKTHFTILAYRSFWVYR